MSLRCPECGRTSSVSTGKEFINEHAINCHLARVHGVRKKPGGVNETDSRGKKGRSNAEANHISYAFGHCEAWLEAYAESAGVSRTALTGGVAQLLLRKTRRSVLGSLNSLS